MSSTSTSLPDSSRASNSSYASHQPHAEVVAEAVNLKGKDLGRLNWLTQELEEEILQWQPTLSSRPEESDIDLSTGIDTNKARLQSD